MIGTLINNTCWHSKCSFAAKLWSVDKVLSQIMHGSLSASHCVLLAAAGGGGDARGSNGFMLGLFKA